MKPSECKVGDVVVIERGYTFHQWEVLSVGIGACLAMRLDSGSLDVFQDSQFGIGHWSKPPIFRVGRMVTVPGWLWGTRRVFQPEPQV